jgi:hypothetical protein
LSQNLLQNGNGTEQLKNLEIENQRLRFVFILLIWKKPLFREELAGTCLKSELNELRRKLEDAESEITNMKSMTPPRAERFVLLALAFESYHICTPHEILV